MLVKWYLHLVLDHLIDQLVLALGDLDDLLDQASAELALQIVDAAAQISITFRRDPWDMRWTYASMVYCGSGANTVGLCVRWGL
jgi:hypothetical protein